MKNLNYPVKYSVLELKENGGFMNHYDEIVRGYIVSKCYLVESSTKYYVNGESEQVYKVVFPYTNLEKFKSKMSYSNSDLGEPTYPRYDNNGNVCNYQVVEDLYDSYEQASAIAKYKNGKLHSRFFSMISILDSDWKGKLDTFERDFCEELAICDAFEKVIEKNTDNMEVSTVGVQYKKERD